MTVNELERGDLFVFYRPKVDAEDASEVQRLYLVLVNSSHYRLLLVGANALPANENSQKPSARRWLQVRAVETRSSEIENFLQGGDYQTKTRGRQHLPPAAPVGEGRYALVDTGEGTQLVWQLRRPKEGELARTLGLREKASYVVSVKNPDVSVEGFPTDRPDYPEQLTSLFQDRRWIPVRNSGLLNYPNAQLIFINAAGNEGAGDFGLTLDPEKADVRATIDLDLPEEGLLKSRFPDLASFADRHHGEISPDFGAGGSEGGREAARSSDSASAVARLLRGLEFPAGKMTILRRARANLRDSGDAEPALERLEHLPRQKFSDMAELQKVLSRETSEGTYPCEICGKIFEQASLYRSHLESSHPEQAVSATDLAAALKGIDLPARPPRLKKHAESKNASSRVVKVLASLPDRSYRDLAEVEEGFSDSLTE